MGLDRAHLLEVQARQLPEGGGNMLIDDINREFPYQVALSLKDDVRGVLDWLDSRIGRWDTYVDLKAQTIRYCFREEWDAICFNRLFFQRAVGVSRKNVIPLPPHAEGDVATKRRIRRY
jgi:hypothetical protein